MRRAIAGLALAVTLCAGAPASARTTAVGIGLHEYRLAPYRDRVLPGTVKFNVFNLGEDGHNFVVRRLGGRVVATMDELRAGERRTFRVKLKSVGRYTLVCTLADHEIRGMRARLTVSKRR